MKSLFKHVVVSILTFEAKVLLHRMNPTIIAVTGSVGKTSTKDAIYAVLKNQIRTRKSQKSFNSDIGVPLTVLGLQNAWNSPLGWFKNLAEGLVIALFARDYPEVLVLETGVDRPGDMKQLTSWLKPDIVVLTRLPQVPVHVEYFSSPEEVAAEKLQLVRALRDDGILIYNHDDEKIIQAVEEVRQTAFGYSRYSPSHFHVTADKVIYDGSEPAGLEFTLTHVDESVKLSVHASLGVQHAYNYAAAVAVGALFNVPLQTAAAALAEATPPPGRMRLIRGRAGTLFIDDTYNASPTAMEQALVTLREVKHVKRKIAVLGDMMELGQYSVREHERIGALVAQSAHVLLTVGVRARKIAEGALENGMDEATIFQYEHIERAAEELSGMLKTGDLVLVKASQSIRGEKLVKELMQDPDQAPELLVRQEAMWLQR